MIMIALVVLFLLYLQKKNNQFTESFVHESDYAGFVACGPQGQINRKNRTADLGKSDLFCCKAVDSAVVVQETFFLCSSSLSTGFMKTYCL